MERRSASPKAGFDPDNPRDRAAAIDFVEQLLQFPAPSVAACRRLRADRRAGSTRLVPIHNAAMDGPHLHRMGQGRYRRARPDEGRCAGARHADLHPQELRPDARATAWAITSSNSIIDADDPAVYDMLCKGDSIGVFQVESRAQINMLPRLQAARTLRSRRAGRDRAARADRGRHGASLSAPPRRARSRSNFPRPRRRMIPTNCKTLLGKTFGVPLFQEQAMKLAIIAAELHAGRGQPLAPRDGDLPQCRHACDNFERQDDRRHGRARL